MSNVNHDYDNDVQRGLYGEEAQALANKIAENVSTSRKPMIHELKILPEYFNEVQSHISSLNSAKMIEITVLVIGFFLKNLRTALIQAENVVALV